MKNLLTTSNVIWVLAIAGVGYGVYTYMEKNKGKATETKPEETKPLVAVNAETNLTSASSASNLEQNRFNCL